jgi:hypothetical protein
MLKLSNNTIKNEVHSMAKKAVSPGRDQISENSSNLANEEFMTVGDS